MVPNPVEVTKRPSTFRHLRETFLNKNERIASMACMFLRHNCQATPEQSRMARGGAPRPKRPGLLRGCSGVASGLLRGYSEALRPLSLSSMGVW